MFASLAISVISFSLLFRSDPIRPAVVHCLAMTRLQRHMLSDRREDLDKSIFSFHRIDTPPPNLLVVTRSNYLHALFILAFALLTRSKLSKQPEDAIYACQISPPSSKPASRGIRILAPCSHDGAGECVGILG
ncbi:hypothetical protein EDB89DRAFT_653226 [Lactarius sanguifluus]|nr:hypothetical protein EDB89DRAFT_653226 [Lactarius sanguifluus]